VGTYHRRTPSCKQSSLPTDVELSRRDNIADVGPVKCAVDKVAFENLQLNNEQKKRNNIIIRNVINNIVIMIILVKYK